MLLSTLIVTILGLRCLTSTETANRRFDLEFYEFICKNIANRILVFECSFKKLELPNHYVFRQYLMFNKDMGENFEVRFWVHIRPSSSKTGMRFIDLKIKACDVLDNYLENPLLKKIFFELQRTANLPHMCPFKANFLYKTENYTANTKLVPNYMPILNFTFGVEYYEKTQLIGVLKIIGATVPKKN
uniref:MD-2-related lipid-recognition domain-containing protein n=1 Tax=Stomoxys calcitrans TaxID=35570 RepID=A0A1I8NXD5_STOCA